MKKGSKKENFWKSHRIIVAVIILLIVSVLIYQGLTGYAGKTTVIAQCEDHKDNDKNGYCDYNYTGAYCSDGSKLGDSGCSSNTDTTEKCVKSNNGVEICDGIDNDCDKVTDEGCNVQVPPNNTNSTPSPGSDFKCAPFFNSTWSNSSGVLSNFDSNRYTTGLSVVNDKGNYALQASGTINEHVYERVDIKNLANLVSWGGTLYVNLKDLVQPALASMRYYDSIHGGYLGPSTVAILGAYKDSGWTRNFVIAAYECNAFQVAPTTSLCIYMRGYHNSCLSESVAKSEHFFINDTKPVLTTNFTMDWSIAMGKNLTPPWDGKMAITTGWPDRYIKIDWYFSNYTLYGRVDNQPWQLVYKTPYYNDTNPLSFTKLAVGWVSSYSGGNVKVKNLLVYNSTCIPS